MKREENECVSCGLPCLGCACPLSHVIHWYCDECKQECRELYEFEGQEICEDCLLDKIPKVKMD